MSGMDPGLKKKFDTKKMSVEDLKLCKTENARMQTTKMSVEDLKLCKTEDARMQTTKMSVEDLKLCKTEDARRPPPIERKGVVSPAGASLHQQGGGQGFQSKAGRLPVVLAGVAVLTGISTFLHYRSVNVQPLHGNNQSSVHANET